jgi:hypothetical protein
LWSRRSRVRIPSATPIEVAIGWVWGCGGRLNRDQISLPIRQNCLMDGICGGGAAIGAECLAALRPLGRSRLVAALDHLQ